jgi:hypothetical protein
MSSDQEIEITRRDEMEVGMVNSAAGRAPVNCWTVLKPQKWTKEALPAVRNTPHIGH